MMNFIIFVVYNFLINNMCIIILGPPSNPPKSPEPLLARHTARHMYFM